MTSPITNRFDEITERPKLDAEQVRIYAPENEWTYSHHSFITYFSGKFYAMFSNGKMNEDDVGQRVLLASSSDFSRWSEPVPLIDTQMGMNVEYTFTAGGFYVYNGTIAAYANRSEYNLESLVDGHRPKGRKSPGDHISSTLMVCTGTDGENWGRLQDLKIPTDPNFSPQPTSTGRLIISGHTMFPYTDDPAGCTGWVQRGIYPDAIKDDVVDDPSCLGLIHKQAGWEARLCEGSFYETDNGVLHMLLRSDQPRIWVTESKDNGETWSDPEPTAFTNNTSKFHMGRLPDGRFYHIGNPDPKPVMDRYPLMLSLSEDGIVFDQQFIIADDVYEMKAEGMHKNGQFGYPHSIVHDDALYMICSRRKEAIDVFKVDLKDIQGL